MKPSTMIVLVLMVPALLGYLYYGWLLYQTITSELNPWIKALFATTFILWLLPLIGLVSFAIIFWREKDPKKEGSLGYFGTCFFNTSATSHRASVALTLIMGILAFISLIGMTSLY